MKRKLGSHKKFRAIFNQNGFTLIESLLVLFCVAVLVTVSLLLGKVMNEKVIFDNAVQKFIATVFEAQTLAGELNDFTTVKVHEGQVVLTAGEDREITKWPLPKDMSINIQTTNKAIQFTKFRTISRLGSVEFISHNFHDTYTINMGFGRLRKR